MSRITTSRTTTAVIVAAVLMQALFASSASAVTFVVNTNSGGLGDWQCDAAECTLLEAVFATNINPGPDEIRFSLPGSRSIRPDFQVQIGDTVVLDGGPLRIELDGSAREQEDVLQVTADNCVLRGIVANRTAGIRVEGTGNVVEDCRIGTDPSGSVAVGDSVVRLDIQGGFNNVARNNLVVGSLTLAGHDSVITGNLVGTDATGTIPLGNVSALFGGGINITIGGPNAAERNVVHGYLRLSGEQSRVQGNFIGVDVTGRNAFPPASGSDSPLVVEGDDNVIGGPGAGNVIAGNDASSGSAAVVFEDNTHRNVVQGNLIGTDVDARPLGNTGIGISIGGDDNRIGGPSAGEGNTIAFSSGAGIEIVGVRNRIQGNSIHDNGRLGIDLSDPFEGVTDNDAGDGDSGPNDLQNFPTVTAVSTHVSSPPSTSVRGTLDSTPSRTFTVDLYSSAACDASGHGEGEFYLGCLPVTTDASGHAAFDATFPNVLPPSGHGVFTATATDSNGSTSEFSPCRGGTPVDVHDLAVTSITPLGDPPAKVVLSSRRPAKTKTIKVTIENRSRHEEVIQNGATLASLLSLDVHSLGPCADPVPTLMPPRGGFPVTVKRKNRAAFRFVVTFSCANMPTAGSPDYTLRARVNHLALDSVPDAHTVDDVCPRSVAPPGLVDPNPDGTIVDKGCGAAKGNGTFGGDVAIDVRIK